MSSLSQCLLHGNLRLRSLPLGDSACAVENLMRVVLNNQYGLQLIDRRLAARALGLKEEGGRVSLVRPARPALRECYV